ncbi:MAG TPA: type II secretion system minor pseudopilin GspK [Bordetella sp.]
MVTFQPTDPHRQRGAAVIAALIIVAIVAALCSSLFLRQTATVRQVENEEARVQARWLLTGGIDWARLILREHSSRESSTQGDQIWAVPVQDTRITQPGDDRVALFSGMLEDEQGKFNLYNLASNGVIAADQLALLQRLMANLNLPASLAQQMAALIAQSQPRGVLESAGTPAAAGVTGSVASTPDQTNAAAGLAGASAQANTAASPAAAPMPRNIDDVAGFLGADEATRLVLARAMTVLPVNTVINVNTAPPEVIAALVPGLSLAQASNLTGDRDRGHWFVDTGDFANRIASLVPEVPAPQVTVTSAWFMATGTVAYERARLTLRALLSSVGGGTSLLWTQEIS